MDSVYSGKSDYLFNKYQKRQEGRGDVGRGVSRLAHEGWHPRFLRLDTHQLHLPWTLAPQWPHEIGKKKEGDKDKMSCVDFNKFKGPPS